MTSFYPGATGEKCTGISCTTPVHIYSDPGYEFCEKKDCPGIKLDLYKKI